MLQRNIYLLAAIASLSGCAEREQSANLNSSEALHRVADSLNKSGDTEGAARLYQQVVDVNPENNDAQLKLAIMHRENGRYDLSLKILESLRKEKTPDAALDIELGKTYLAKNETDKAREAFLRANQGKEPTLSCLNGLGICADLAGDHAAAQDFYQQALVLDPGNPNIESNKGLSLALSGKYKEAIACLQKNVEGDANHQNARHNLALAYGLSGDFERAREVFAKDLDPESVENNITVLMELHGDSGPISLQTLQSIPLARLESAGKIESVSLEAAPPRKQRKVKKK